MRTGKTTKEQFLQLAKIAVIFLIKNKKQTVTALLMAILASTTFSCSFQGEKLFFEMKYQTPISQILRQLEQWVHPKDNN